MADFNLKPAFDNVLLVAMQAAKIEDNKIKAMIAGMGNKIDTVATWAEVTATTLDTDGSAVSVNDTIVLATADADGVHPAGLYSRKADNSGWNDIPDMNYDDLDIGAIKSSILATQGEFDSKAVDKAPTVAQVFAQFLVNDGVNETKFHPRQGDATLTIVAKAGAEGTDEVVTANQLATTPYTTAEASALYNS